MFNATAEQQHWGFLQRLMFSTLTTVPCCVFFYINAVMLFTLRSKTVFCESPRFILLFNLLFADTLQMLLSHVLYMLVIFLIKLNYPVCGFFNVIVGTSTHISPLTLVVMSLERYVAVCYPLRHAVIITSRNTGMVIIGIWALSLLNFLIRISLVDFSQFESLQMKEFCSSVSLFIGPLSDAYNRACTCLLFVTAGGTIAFSYISVTVAAFSLSADQSSSRRTRNTLLLHLVQLGLSLSSTLYKPLLTIVSRFEPSIVFVRVQNGLYLSLFILPRCLSAFIYGIRDQTIRPVLFYHLCCRLTISVFPAKGFK